MGTGSLPGVKRLAPHPLIVPWSWKSRAIPLLPLWAVRPEQSLSACTRVHCNFSLYQFQISFQFQNLLTECVFKNTCKYSYQCEGTFTVKRTVFSPVSIIARMLSGLTTFTYHRRCIRFNRTRPASYNCTNFASLSAPRAVTSLLTDTWNRQARWK